LHSQNVNALIEQSKRSLDYCQQQFGTYPFRSITYAEVPSFVRGFNATAYPGVIFMTEQMAFTSNLQAEPDNDVIMELAAHELSHYWWGNNQLSPDEREGASMLTESLAMYTEMMLYKQQYGAAKMKARLVLHEQIYQAEKGYFKPEPLYKVSLGATHLAYSKGALVMVKLAELLGEEKMNLFLKEFLERYKYPYRATTLDFLELLKSRVPATKQEEILSLFTSMD
jgi:aminopeptidase N